MELNATKSNISGTSSGYQLDFVIIIAKNPLESRRHLAYPDHHIVVKVTQATNDINVSPNCSQKLTPHENKSIIHLNWEDSKTQKSSDLSILQENHSIFHTSYEIIGQPLLAYLETDSGTYLLCFKGSEDLANFQQEMDSLGKLLIHQNLEKNIKEKPHQFHHLCHCHHCLSCKENKFS